MTRSSFVGRIAVIVVLTSCLISMAFAQFNASIQGTLTDNTGAVIPGVTVTVTNNQTGVIKSTQSTDAGVYRVGALIPGDYSVTFEGKGFKKAVRDHVTVAAERTLGLDMKLELGSVEQSVTVSGEAGAGVQTETANISGTINQQMLDKLPEYGRDPYELLRLAPGVFGDGARSGNGTAAWFPNTPGPGQTDTSGIFNQENYVQVSANGQRPSANNFMIDGTSVNSLTWGGAAVITPNLESVQEVAVTSSAYSAEDGRNTGAQVKVVTKSGTNALHGSAYFKYDEPGLNAYNKWGGPDPGEKPTRVETAGRDFAGSIGGPIVKNKLFFFFSYEGNIQNSSSLSTQWIETPQFDQWVATNRPNTPVAQVLATGNNAPRIYNIIPATAARCADFAGQGWQAPGGAPFCQVAGNGLDLGSPTGAYGTYAPFFNGDTRGGGLDGIADVEEAQILLPLSSRGNQFNTRIDFTQGKNTFSFTGYYVPRNDDGATNSGRPSQDLNFDPRNRFGAIIWNRTISPTLLNEFRFNTTRQQNNQYASNPDTYWGLPAFQVEAIPLARVTWGPSEGTNSPLMSAQNQFEFRDMVSKTFGRHVLKFGVNLTLNQDNTDYELGGIRPVYVFHGLWNLANGAPIYEAYQGDPTTGAPTDDHKYYRQRDWAGFVQDDFKLRPNLTLNIGLRYEYFGPLNEKYGRQSNLLLGSGADALTVGEKLVQANPLYQADKANFAPRLGFAWSPWSDNKTVIRGGFGMAYNRITDTMTAISRRNPPYMFAYGLCCGTAANEWGTPFVNNTIDLNVIGGNLKSLYNYGANPALINNYDPTTGLPVNGSVEIWGTPQHLHTPRTYLWSLNWQQELPWQLVASLEYQGSDSPNVFRIVNQDFIYPVNNNTTAVYFPTTDAWSNYNAMLFNLTRSFAHGVQLFGKYRWSKSLDTVSAEGACACTNQFYPPDQTYDYGPSDYDATHNIQVTALYDLPKFVKPDSFASSIVNGWHIDGTYQWHSGFPWSAIIGNCLPVPNGNNICPNLPEAYLGGAGSDYSNQTFTTQGGNFPGGGSKYFLVSNPVTLPIMHRNSFRGPRYRDFDLALAKATKVPWFGSEGATLDLRANLFNVFNQLNLQPFQYNAANTNITDSHFGESLGALAGRVVDFQVHFTF